MSSGQEEPQVFSNKEELQVSHGQEESQVLSSQEESHMSSSEEVQPLQVVKVPVSNSMSRASSLQELISYEYYLDADYSDVSGLVFEPLGIDESALDWLLTDYFDMLPVQLKAVLAPLSLLITETHSNNNACWLWALIHNKIVGLLVYAAHAAAPSTAATTIHHCSCLSFAGYPQILAKAEQYVAAIENPDYLRIDFFVKRLNIFVIFLYQLV